MSDTDEGIGSAVGGTRSAVGGTRSAAKKTLNAVEETDGTIPKPVYYRRRMKSRPPTNESGIRIVRYSEASYALLGDTISYKDVIAAAGCKFNSSLSDPVNGNIVPGWVCRCINKEVIVDALKRAGASYELIDK